MTVSCQHQLVAASILPSFLDLILSTSLSLSKYLFLRTVIFISLQYLLLFRLSLPSWSLHSRWLLLQQHYLQLHVASTEHWLYQVLVAFNIHPTEQCLQRLFDRYSTAGNGLVERSVFEEAVLNGNIPKHSKGRRNTARTKESAILKGHMQAQQQHQDLLQTQQRKLEKQAMEILDLLKQAKAVNSRVLQMQDTLESGRRSGRTNQSRTPGGIPRSSRSRHRTSTPLGLQITGGSSFRSSM